MGIKDEPFRTQLESMGFTDLPQDDSPLTMWEPKGTLTGTVLLRNDSEPRNVYYMLDVGGEMVGVQASIVDLDLFIGLDVTLTYENGKCLITQFIDEVGEVHGQ